MDKTLVINDLLPIYQTTDTGEKVVDARELCGFLGVASRYNDWIRSRIEKYGFKEGEDFTALTENLVSGGKQNVHILKLDMAKELAMVENNEQGRKARRYFIEVEKRFKDGEPKVPLADVNHDKITRLLQMLKMAEKENLFNTTTDAAFRQQIAEMITGGSQVLQAPKVVGIPISESPVSSGRWYTSKEVAVIAGVTVHLIAKLATQHGVRSPEYCRYQSNCKREGDRFTGLTWPEYNEAGKNLLVRYATERLANGYVPKLRGKKVRRR